MRRRFPSLLLFLVAGLTSAPQTRAQVVIRETVRISPDSVAALQATTAAGKTGAVLSNFVSSADGMLKVHYVKAERQGSPLDASVLLQAEIQRAGGPENHADAVLYRFPAPLQSSNADCTGDWNYYGEGPFTYTAPSLPANVNDAMVFSLPCSADYAQQTGNCETSNFGTHPAMPVMAWTWLGDPAVIRSYVQFDLSGFPAAVDSVEESTLHLTPTRHRAPVR